MTWDTDTQFEEHKLTQVVGGELGWSLYFDGMGIFCPGNICEKAPAVGETARLYGKGFGYSVRGIVIEGRVYRYLTEEEEKAKFASAQTRAKQKRQAELDAERPARDARRAALPEAFRERLDTFEKRNPDWRREFEPYELMVCEDAALLAAHFGQDTLALKAFSEKPWEEQHALIPALDAGHSGNSWGCAVSLALRFMMGPEFIRGAHGALCPLVGCTEYGCPGADVKKEEP